MPRKILTITVLFSIMIAGAIEQAVAEDSKITIATMNLQKVIAVSKTGQAAKKAVTKKFEDYQNKIKKEEESLLSLKDEIEKKGAVWSDEVRTKKEREFKRRVQALEEESQYASNDMKEFEKEKVEPILKELEGIIEKFGKNKGYTLILDTSRGVLYQDDSIDISSKLAAELDKQHPEIK